MDMEQAGIFVIKSIAVSAILMAWYRIALSNKKIHTYNRWYLLFTLLASVVLPLLRFRWPFTSGVAGHKPMPAVITYAMNAFSEKEPVVTAGATGFHPDWGLVLACGWLVVSIALTGVLVVRIGWVARMARKYPGAVQDGIRFIKTDLAKAPFSFFNYLFWKEGIPLETESGQLIYRHELAHITQRHSIDKIASQLLTCMFWMNPFYWLIQRELNMIHEFIADEQAIAPGGPHTGVEDAMDAFARMVLQTYHARRYFVPEHQFFYSPIKRRLVMLQTSPKMKYALLRRAMVLPLVCGAVLAFSFTNRGPVKNEMMWSDKKIVVVLDPGHGGVDIGGHTANLQEKDLNLKIARKLSELAPGFNIEVHLTRTADVYPSLEERLDISNKVHPDYFISVHIADAPGKDNTKGNFSVFVSATNAKIEESKALGAAICHEVNVTDGNLNDNMAIETKGIYVLKNNPVPSITLSLGDIKSTEEMQYINDDDRMDALCNAIWKGVVAYNKGR